MILFHTKLNVSDNSGGRLAQCIKVINKKYSVMGDLITVVIKSLRRTIKIKRITNSSIYKGVVIRVKKKTKTTLNTYIRFSDNALVILSGSGSPLSSRIYGSVDQSIRKKTLNLKIITLARIIT